jgi:ribonucleoside-diphosphate reductase alpha chain
MPDYLMRWLASRFIEDSDVLEDLGILTPEVRARREAQQSLLLDDGPEAGEAAGAKEGNGNGSHAGNGSREPVPPTAALTDAPPVIPAQMQGRDLGPACEQCGGMMQRTGSCYTCTSCGNNTGCG